MLGAVAIQYQRSKRRSASANLPPGEAAQVDFYRNVWFGGQALPWLILGAGTLSGHLQDIWSVFRLRDGNGFVIAFIGATIAMVWAGAGWLIAGGARKVVALRLVEQFGDRTAHYTERGVKIGAGMAMLAPLLFVLACLSMGEGGGFPFQFVSAPPLAVSADGYRVAFDLARSGFSQWGFGAFGLILVVIASVLVYFRKDLPGRGPVFVQRAYPFVFLAFAIGWTVLTFTVNFSQYRRLSNAIAEGRVKVVEGPVADFVPMPAEGHAREHFCVRQACFSYSDFVIGGGFNHAASHGGPIRAGLPVRVTYVDGDIVKLELAPH